MKDLRALAQTHTLEAITTIIAVMRDPEAPAHARLTAANSILDRGYGKPTEHVEIEGEIGLYRMSDDDVRARALVLIAKARGEGDG